MQHIWQPCLFTFYFLILFFWYSSVKSVGSGCWWASRSQKMVLGVENLYPWTWGWEQMGNKGKDSVLADLCTRKKQFKSPLTTSSKLWPWKGQILKVRMKTARIHLDICCIGPKSLFSLPTAGVAKKGKGLFLGLPPSAVPLPTKGQSASEHVRKACVARGSEIKSALSLFSEVFRLQAALNHEETY